MFRSMGEPFDCEGRLAAQGVVDEEFVACGLALPFFAAPPPKSLDRNAFAALELHDMAPADGAATLTAFTAAAIASIGPLLPKPPVHWIITGGGARNLTLLRMLRARLGPAEVETADSLGWSGDAMEAQAFGFLAVRGLKGLPLHGLELLLDIAPHGRGLRGYLDTAEHLRADHHRRTDPDDRRRGGETLVGWAKAPLRRAHRLHVSAVVGTRRRAVRSDALPTLQTPH